MTSDNLMQAVTRLMKIEWSTRFTFRHSHRYLMREYLRRMAHWAQALEYEDEWCFFDIAAQINPAIRVDQQQIKLLKQSIPIYSRVMGNTILWYVQLAGLSDKQDLPCNLPAPYEPLIVMYERGGSFSFEQGYVDTEGGSVRVKTLSENLQSKPVVELRAELLDQLDNTKPEEHDRILKG